MTQKVKRTRKRKEPHKTRPFYLHNEDHPKMEPAPEHSKWIAAIILTVIVAGIAFYLCSCSDFGEMPYGLGTMGQTKCVLPPHKAVHVPSAEDGP